MAHSFLSVYLHIVFSTKNRKPRIPQAKRQRLWNYLAGIAANHKMKALSIGGMSEHVHILLSLASEVGVSKAVNLLKSNSSKWMREEDAGFTWQEGYAAFSVSRSSLASVVEYIENQEEHHKKRDFAAEYLALLRRHGIEYDPAWVFG